MQKVHEVQKVHGRAGRQEGRDTAGPCSVSSPGPAVRPGRVTARLPRPSSLRPPSPRPAAPPPLPALPAPSPRRVCSVFRSVGPRKLQPAARLFAQPCSTVSRAALGPRRYCSGTAGTQVISTSREGRGNVRRLSSPQIHASTANDSVWLAQQQ